MLPPDFFLDSSKQLEQFSVHSLHSCNDRVDLIEFPDAASCTVLWQFLQKWYGVTPGITNNSGTFNPRRRRSAHSSTLKCCPFINSVQTKQSLCIAWLWKSVSTTILAILLAAPYGTYNRRYDNQKPVNSRQGKWFWSTVFYQHEFFTPLHSRNHHQLKWRSSAMVEVRSIGAKVVRWEDQSRASNATTLGMWRTYKIEVVVTKVCCW